MGRLCWAQPSPAASQSCRLTQSPTDALINLVIGGRLFGQIPIRIALHPVIPSVMNAISRICPPQMGHKSGKSQSVGDRAGSPRVTAVCPARSQESGDEHGPKVMGWALGLYGLGRGHDWVRCAAWRSGTPRRCPLCADVPWQRVDGRNTAAAAPMLRWQPCHSYIDSLLRTFHGGCSPIWLIDSQQETQP